MDDGVGARRNILNNKKVWITTNEITCFKMNLMGVDDGGRYKIVGNTHNGDTSLRFTK